MNEEFYIRFANPKKYQIKRQSDLNKRNTPGETWFKSMLEAEGFRKLHDNGNFMRCLYESKAFIQNMPIGYIYADFVFLKFKLIIEIDGIHHYKKEQIEKDLARTQYLRKLGFYVYRIPNRNERKANIIINKILQNLDALPPDNKCIKTLKPKRELMTPCEYRKKSYIEDSQRLRNLGMHKVTKNEIMRLKSLTFN